MNSAYEFLLSLPRYDKRGAASLKPGFDRIERLLALVGNPHRAYPVAHIAGTNGKGSTSSMLSAICTAAGMRAGLHTSPHLFDVTERMRIDGQPASADWLSGAVRNLRVPIERVGPSFFEATTALSFLYFAEQNVDIAVVEVGLGGRLDATNIVNPMVCGITSIGIDHVAILGSDIRMIAAEKAGIIKPGIPVFTSNAEHEIVDVLRAAAERNDAPFQTVSAHFEEARVETGGARPVIRLMSRGFAYGAVELDLPGIHQLGNAALAVAMAEQIVADPVSAVHRAMPAVRQLSGLRGRLEILQTNPLVVADVGHNASGVQTAMSFAREMCSGELHVGVGLLQDKDYRSIAAGIAGRANRVYVIPLDGERALDPGTLADAFREHGAEVRVAESAREVFASFQRQARPADGLLLVGSHQVVAQLDRKLP